MSDATQQRTGVDWATGVRRVAMASAAGILVGLVLVTFESALGISFWWRMALNQIPVSLTMFAVLRWSESA